MSRSKRPRRPYRPKLACRPVLDAMRNQLILPAYVALETLRTGSDANALESARHSLAACLDYMGVACRLACRPADVLDAIEGGTRALIEVIRRQERVGAIRATGPELQALREAVVVCDESLPYLRTDQIQAAVLNVDRKLFGGEIAANLRLDGRIDMEVAR